MNLKKPLLALALAATAAGAANAQPGVSVSIDINEPGVYGRINIGEAPPPPALVLPRPVLIAPPRLAVAPPPVYLYVPPYQQRDWRRYCGRYEACGRPVYFVRDSWVRERYAHEHPGWHGGPPRPGWDHRDWRDDPRGPRGY